MSASFSDEMETRVLKWAFNIDTGGAPTRPTNLWAALHTAIPDEDASPTNECSYTNYARVDVSTSPAFTVSGNTVTNSAAAITFAANGDVGSVTVTHLSIWSASTNGTLYTIFALPASKTLAQNESISFPTSTVTFTLD